MSDGVKKQEPIYTRGPFMLFVGPIFTDLTGVAEYRDLFIDWVMTIEQQNGVEYVEGATLLRRGEMVQILFRRVRGTRVPNPLYKV